MFDGEHASHSGYHAKRPDVPPQLGSELFSTQRKRKGSRLSLTSLLSLTTSQNRQTKDRHRSEWSYEEPGKAMSSISSTDLRLNESGNIGTNRRNLSIDVNLCQDDDGRGAILPLSDSRVQGAERSEISGKKKQIRGSKILECPLCCMRQPSSNFPRLICCQHRSCRLCLMQYVEMEIMENRVEVSCPECAAHLHPLDIKSLAGGRTDLIEKYEQFSVRRYLMTEPDARWCPAPDCGRKRASLAASFACSSSTHFWKSAYQQFERLSYTLFISSWCNCDGVWHPSQTCDEARRQRGAPTLRTARRITSSSLDIQLKPGDIKACPRCHTYIVKMDDGSCNHMVCAMCSVEFCWLCLKEISDLHYLSPTGCTFWGKKPWTRKKKLLWQLGTLIGAPVGIAIIAGLSIPGIIFGVPVFVGRKVHQRLLHHSNARRRLLTAACVVGSLFISPVLAVMAVGVGVPIMLAYVYGVVPLSLCRNGGCGISESNSQTDALNDDDLWTLASHQDKSQLLSEMDRPDGSSLVAELSLQSGISGGIQHHVRLAVNDIRRRTSVDSGVNSLCERINYEEASTRAMAGSHYHYDDKALAGSVLDSKSLSESSGARVVAPHHDHGTDDVQAYTCATPSTSSTEHNEEKLCMMNILTFYKGCSYMLMLVEFALIKCCLSSFFLRVDMRTLANFRSYVDETPTLSAPRRRSDRIRVVVAYPRADDSEQMLLLADDPGPSGEVRGGVVPMPSTSSTQPDLREELDPPSGTSRSTLCGRTFRSGSARSLSTIAVQSFEVGQSVGAAPKRRSILHSLFSSKKNGKK
ncbi:unnamed protein product [Strongylus vulgaris]|uniref:RBR-type E3 ubiquitin transferase n=1 Tax=Strongylus vulgaris TaxID=40348 RepID=A0A3P7L8M8_STRVU|nr:unnamed protein product [Strongylus vulgaris]